MFSVDFINFFVLITTNYRMADLNNDLTGYFISVCTAGYRFWAHLIWAPKLGKPEGKMFCESKLRYFI